MNKYCTLQLYADGAWHDIASTSLLGPENQGWRTPTYTGYDASWALAHSEARDAWALSSRFPVSLAPHKAGHWPVFLIDMLPQGFGRGELLRQLNLPETMEAEADWRLLLAGAGNLIGHLRIKEAADWLAQRHGPLQGFTDETVAARSEDFMSYLSQYGLFVAGSSGVQGEWPKILLTRARDGLLYLDHTLPDEDALEHFIVKFGRGSNLQLAAILQHEAPYMAIAAQLGLRVHAPLTLRKRSLFIPRFDRTRREGKLVRLAQESLATLVNRPGFGVVPAHEEACQALVEVCTNPAEEILEYLRRDVANLALGNKDNHARNTAVQRDFDGNIRMTPVFDFAPMYLHPDGIARRIRWAQGEQGGPDWAGIVDRLGEAHQLPRDHLVNGLRSMLPVLDELLIRGDQFGLAQEVHQYLVPSITAQLRALETLV